MKYQVSHVTTYRYSEPVPLGHNEAHLTPRRFERQECLDSRLAVWPAPAILRTWTDYFGNPVIFFALEEEHAKLTVTSTSVVELFESRWPAGQSTPDWETVRAALAAPADAAALAAALFRFDSPYARCHPRLAEYAGQSFTPGRPLLDAALDLTARIHGEFRYDPAATNVHTPILDVFEKRRGVCQDFAHLEIACLRSLGLAARYVSGYLSTDPPAGQERLVGADASHAWASLYCPGMGWLDLDPTNNQMPTLRHVTIAWGRDYGDVCPIKGVFIGGGHHGMSVAVDVVRQSDGPQGPPAAAAPPGWADENRV
jgi:transglutaminase-like putative cysteine protease